MLEYEHLEVKKEEGGGSTALQAVADKLKHYQPLSPEKFDEFTKKLNEFKRAPSQMRLREAVDTAAELRHYLISRDSENHEIIEALAMEISQVGQSILLKT